jgi:hypothetical protein
LRVLQDLERRRVPHIRNRTTSAGNDQYFLDITLSYYDKKTQGLRQIHGKFYAIFGMSDNSFDMNKLNGY